MNGWVGKILRVNLTKQKTTIEDLNPEDAKNYIGSSGLAVKYLYDEIDPAVDALGPKNKIMMATGPLTGTYALAAARYMVVTKSPLTGAIANSNSGGYFGPELKFAGFDMIILEGKSKNPVYIWIENDQVEIRDAAHLWGMETKEVTALLLEETDIQARVACIGPGGENKALMANIMNDTGRAAGRSGVGAVMGSKNLKAVVVRGTKGVTVADGFREAVLEHKKGLTFAYVTDTLSSYGTSDVVLFTNEFGVLPTRNFQTGVFGGAEKIGGMEVAKYNLRGVGRTKACMGCQVACGRVTRVSGGEFKAESEGPEFETIAAFGANCGIDNIEAIIKANTICNQMGMDTISMGTTIACAMELFEKGHITEKDAGMSLKFGDASTMVKLVEMTAKNEGFGKQIAQGSYCLAEKYGHPEFSMTSKKLEFPGYDPRGGQGYALAYATNSRGGCHIRCEPHAVELFGSSILGIIPPGGENIDRFVTDGKADLVRQLQNYYCLIDAFGLCNFVCVATPDENIIFNLVEKATGVSFGGAKGFLKAGERIFNLERLFNLKAGLTTKDDSLPKRMLEVPMPEGATEGQVVQLNKMLPEYYKLRGWDTKGVPTEKKLKELGLVT